MINRIHFTTFGGGLYPGGGRLIIGCVFLFIRERACNWATSFPARFSPGKTALGTRLPIDGPITRQPRSQSPPPYPSLRSRTFCEFPPALRLGSATENKLACCL